MPQSNKKFNFIMISAMYENGGNTTHRFLDGHPNLFVYPFESQTGNKQVVDYFSSFVPHKYRWPQFGLTGSFSKDYDDIWDEEFKYRVRIPHMSKFKEVDIQATDQERKKIFLNLLKGKERIRANIVEAFFVSTFKAWKNRNNSGKEKIYVGYNPVAIIDADKIIEDFPNAKVVHIIRNPYSAYAETKHRPIPLSLERYITTWNVSQLLAINFSKLYPQNVFIFKFEDLIANPEKFFKDFCKKVGIPFSKELLYPSWNGTKLENLYPWGTIEIPTEKYNKDKVKELNADEKKRIKALAGHFINHFDYTNFS